MGLALLPTALLVLPALLLWPTLAQDSEEPNVRCGGECWVGCRVSQLQASGVHSLSLLCERQAAGQVPFAFTSVSRVLRRSPLRFLLCGC